MSSIQRDKQRVVISSTDVTIPVSGIVTTEPSDKISYCIQPATTETVLSHQQKTVSGYMPFYVILGTLDNAGVVFFDDVDEIQIEGTINNDFLIIYE